MHPALLLDDVLRQILALCPTGCLPAAARSCVAWRDPALDGIWCHIGSLAPLLNLVPGLRCVDGVYTVDSDGPLDLRNFNSYAARVKHITQRHDTRVCPALLSRLSNPGNTILNMLTTTRLSSTDLNCLPAVLSLSPRLRQLDLDCGFKNKKLVDDGSSDYIEKLLCVAPDIEGLRLRGSPNQRVNAGISRMSNLRSLTLRTGAFLTEDTLIAISTFPHLAELHIEAGHLDIDGLTKAWLSPAPAVGCFQSLRKLHVCAQAPVLELLVKIIPPLRTLRIEATTPPASEPTVCWNRIFDLITVNASQTLEELTIEHHLEEIDLDIIPTAIPTTSNTHTSAHSTRPPPQPDRITFDIIRCLAPLRHLRRLTVDMTRMPDLRDEDVEALAMWWPDLVHLDLGSLHSSECIPSASSPRATLACLRAFASFTPRLDTLILPLSIAGVPTLTPAVTASSALTRAIISSSAPPLDPVAMARYLHGLFPRLTEVEGTDRHEAEWAQVQQLLRAPRS